jgi:hypothetical protein
MWAAQSEQVSPRYGATGQRGQEIRRSAEVCLGPYSQTLQRCRPLLVRLDSSFAREKLLKERIIPERIERWIELEEGRSEECDRSHWPFIRYRKQFL